MDRRKFLKIGSGSAAVIIIPPALTHFYDEKVISENIKENFLTPPYSAKPFTWWHWMNGNISEVGINLDLEFMQKAGLGGFQIFQVGTGIPKGPVNFGGDEWLHLLQHAAREADRLGLEYDMMNGGGWSSSGGPWITPELGMKQLTWSETQVRGQKNIRVSLPMPYSKLGFYKDSFVLAFPSPGGGTTYSIDSIKKVTSSNGEMDKKFIIEGKWPKGIEINPSSKNDSSFLQIEFNEPYKAQSIMMYGTGVPGAERWDNEHTISLEASSDGQVFRTVCEFDKPNARAESLEVPSAANFPVTYARFYRFNFHGPFRLFYLRLLPAMCVLDWPVKANYTRRSAVVAGDLLVSTGQVPEESVIDPSSVLDISKYMNDKGQLNWEAPQAGNWTILRLGYTAVGVQNHPSPDGGGGLECDKYSQKAYDFHFEHFFGKLFPFLESMGKKGMSGSVIDSYEVGMQTWTEEFQEEFLKRRGYSFIKYLPSLMGYVVGSGDISDRFLWDIRRTEADMMSDNYYGHFADLCHKHNMKAYCEPYSGGPFDEILSGSYMDIPMGEFWAGMDGNNGIYYSIKLASSIAHVYGKKVVGAESYTGVPSQTKWQTYPFAMKGQGDWMYTMGLNKFIFHVYAMQPNPTAKPGMTMGPWGWMHSRNNTWYKEEKNWLNYVHRTQYVLQQGLLVADLLYYVGEQIPVDTPVLPKQLRPMPPQGYYYDVTDAKAIITRMKADNGSIALPDGMHYRLLILPESEVISLEVLRRVNDLVKQGINIAGPKPSRTPGLSRFPDEDKELMELANEIWGDLDGEIKTERSYGSGKVFWGEPIEAVLKKLDIRPDFEFTSRSGDAPINYIHRTIEGKDIYFIANRRRSSEELVCTFRVHGRKPEFWDPESGEIISVSVFEIWEDKIRIPIRLTPAGSLFVVFDKPSSSGLVKVSKDGKEVSGTAPFAVIKKGLYPDVTNNFSVSVWIKPDVEISMEKTESWLSGLISFVFYPPAGESLYGEGHSAVGLIAGRNGILVIERSQEMKGVLSIPKPISGWSHLVLIYKEGVPSVYLNGELAAQGNKSDTIVHPGLGEALQEDGATYFHGDMGALQLFKETLDGSHIHSLYADGIPAPEDPPVWEYTGNSNPHLLFWQNGKYAFRDNSGQNTSLQVSEISQPLEVKGAWDVSFPPNLGAPEKIRMEKLLSLKDYPDDGVKYFSGTATYSKTIRISPDMLSNNKKLYLDLGWIEVIATVTLNGKDVGTVWKLPYRLEITNEAHPGDNELVVMITNLWPNRLIGDEHLPPENEYGGKGATGPRAEFQAEIKKLPAWYVEGKPKPPGGRITFTTWKHFDKNDPLLESGLLGPVKLRTAILKEIVL